MRWGLVLRIGCLVLAVGVGGSWADEGARVSSWSFEPDPAARAEAEAEGGDDSRRGWCESVAGVAGAGLKLDGYTGHVVCPSVKVPDVGEGFTVEAWVALGAYPWHWCPIVDQQEAAAAGWSFAIDGAGRLGLGLMAGERWQRVVSEDPLPLRTWVHVAGVFDPRSGLALYRDGALAGRVEVEGTFVSADDADVLIGRSREKAMPTESIRPKATLPVFSYFDGIIDELKVHARIMSADEVKRARDAQHPTDRPALSERVLPTGPAGPGDFGAYYTRLTYDPAWDRQWRIGDHADILVRFDEADYRFIFWRGTNYIPCWVTAEGQWYTNEFNETWGHGANGCAEPMSDKQCRHSHVRILESTDARVVIHWRYALIDTRYVFARVDEGTGWGDWSDELYTIYPDGVGVRKITLWSSQPMEPHEFQDSIMIHSPGRRPEDDVESDAVILANMKGESHTYSWAKGLPTKMDKPACANIQVVNLKSPTDPFLIVSDAPCVKSKTGPRFRPYRGTFRPEVSMFPWWNHWPVAPIPCDGRNATAPDRASHSCTTNQLEWADYEVTPNSRTRVMLHGMTDWPAEALATLARSWLQPPELKMMTAGAKSKGYDRAERAYVLSCDEAAVLLEFELGASDSSPVENVALIVEDWGEVDAELLVDGEAVPRGKAFRFGHRSRLDGTDLMVWIKQEARQPTRVALRPIAR